MEELGVEVEFCEASGGTVPVWGRSAIWRFRLPSPLGNRPQTPPTGKFQVPYIMVLR